MAEQTDPRMQRAINVIISMQRTANPEAIEAFMPYIRKDAELLLAEIDGPEPTWRDVIRAMRAEGVRLRPLYDIAESPADRSWRVLSPNDTELGCITHETGYWGEEWTISFTYECGPSASMGGAALKPADVLALARISGLIEGTS